MKEYRIQKTKGLTLDQLYFFIARGGKIISYGYCISIIALTFPLLSSPYFIKPEEKRSRYMHWYNLCTFLFGWWGFPYGIQYTFRMLNLNIRKDGVDITENILEKLKEQYSADQLNIIQEENILVTYSDEELTKGRAIHNHVAG